MSRSGSRCGGIEGRQGSESALFSPPAKTRSEELKRAQLLDAKKHLAPNKMGAHDSAMSATYKEFSTATPVGSDASTDRQGCSNNSLTNDLLQLLVSEISRMRCTLDSVAQDKSLLSEVQTSNKLLAFSLVTGHQLENINHELLVRKTKAMEKTADAIVTTVSPQCK